MSVTYYDAVDRAGLFDVLGQIFAAQSAIATAHGSTVPTEVLELLSIYREQAATTELALAVNEIPQALATYRGQGSSMLSALQRAARRYLIEYLDANLATPLTEKTIAVALAELERAMEADSESLDASAPAVSVTPDGSNTGDAFVIATVTDGTAKTRQFAIPETITGVAVGTSVRLSGRPAVPLLDARWPDGSGANATVRSAAFGVIANGGFDTDDDVTNAPDGWDVSIGTIGTTIKITDPETQTVVITGTPTGGGYPLAFTDTDSRVYQTEQLPFDATGSQVQSALRTLPGLQDLTVTTTGTGPNYTHTIRFVGLGGNVAQLTSINRLTGGSSPTITHNTTSAGTPQVLDGGAALELDSDGSQLTTIQQAVGLRALTDYAVSLWAIADVVPAAGVITIDLVDGIGGTVLQDAAGNNAAVTIDCTDLTTSWQHSADLITTPILRTPEELPTVVYCRIRISTAISSGTSVFLDRFGLVAMSDLYRGGPLVAVVSGPEGPGINDRWSLAVTNDRGGVVHEWMQRNFDLLRLGVVLPTDASGSETIPDSVAS